MTASTVATIEVNTWFSIECELSDTTIYYTDRGNDEFGIAYEGLFDFSPETCDLGPLSKLMDKIDFDIAGGSRSIYMHYNHGLNDSLDDIVIEGELEAELFGYELAEIKFGLTGGSASFGFDVSAKLDFGISRLSIEGEANVDTITDDVQYSIKGELTFADGTVAVAGMDYGLEFELKVEVDDEGLLLSGKARACFVDCDAVTASVEVKNNGEVKICGDLPGIGEQCGTVPRM